jgi:uncharacterized protein YhaN
MSDEIEMLRADLMAMRELVGELTRQVAQLQAERDAYYACYEELAGRAMILAGSLMDSLERERGQGAPAVRGQRLVTGGAEHETLGASDGQG